MSRSRGESSGGGGGGGRRNRGHKKQRGQAHDEVAISGAPRPLACLRSAEVVYDLHEYTTRLGRGRSSDIVLKTSKSISSKHAIISIGHDGKSATLKDLNSLNGTFINNVRVHNASHPIESRDLIKFG